ncbi:MAG: hypothetical protein ACYDH9_12735 [Limisphaerales bacterium]
MKSFPADGLKIRWRKPVGWGWSSSVVTHGRVFLTDAELLKPAARERIHCFEETAKRSRGAVFMPLQLIKFASRRISPDPSDDRTVKRRKRRASHRSAA